MVVSQNEGQNTTVLTMGTPKMEPLIEANSIAELVSKLLEGVSLGD